MFATNINCYFHSSLFLLPHFKLLVWLLHSTVGSKKKEREREKKQCYCFVMMWRLLEANTKKLNCFEILWNEVNSKIEFSRPFIAFVQFWITTILGKFMYEIKSINIILFVFPPHFPIKTIALLLNVLMHNWMINFRILN